MMEFGHFYQLIATSPLASWLNTLPAQLTDWQHQAVHGKFNTWRSIIDQLPALTPDSLDLLDSVQADMALPLATGELALIENRLRMLMPWRKGPFFLYGIHLDAEWRSDWKWQRLLPHISPLAGRNLLDVGCGNGYYLWRMAGQGARLVTGIDPVPLFLCQFAAIRKLLGGCQQVHLLPLSLEKLPPLAAFDTVFSMGVLYHLRSPLEHLYQIKNQLVAGGELILETLVIAGNEQQILVPDSRYAQMRNIYFIPSAAALTVWLKKCGFINVRTVDISITTALEQRRTHWMNTASLTDFLDPADNSKTREGYPAPRRAIIIAHKP